MLATEELQADWAFTTMNFVVGIYPSLVVKNKVKACQITWNILRSNNIITRGAKRLSLLTHFLVGLQYHFKFKEVHTIGDEIIFYLTDRKLASQTSEEHTYLAYEYRVFPKIREGLILVFFQKITIRLIFGGRLLFSFIKNKITK